MRRKTKLILYANAVPDKIYIENWLIARIASSRIDCLAIWRAKTKSWTIFSAPHPLRSRERYTCVPLGVSACTCCWSWLRKYDIASHLCVSLCSINLSFLFSLVSYVTVLLMPSLIRYQLNQSFVDLIHVLHFGKWPLSGKCEWIVWEGIPGQCRWDPARPAKILRRWHSFE